MIIKLLSFEFKGIGRFVSKQSVTLHDRKFLIQMDGRRLDYSGSSGAGKSTVFKANDYILGLNTTPATVLQSRLSKDTIWCLS